MGRLRKLGSMIGNLTGFGISLTDATEQWVPSNQTLNFSQYQGKKLRDRIFMVSVIYAGGFGGFDETDLQNLLKAYEEKSPVEITMPRHFFEGTLVISITAEHKTKNETLKMEEYTKLSAREQQEDYYLVVEYGVAIQGEHQYVMKMSGRADSQSGWMKRFEDCYFKLMHLMCGMKRNPDVKDIVKEVPEYKDGTWQNFALTGNIGEHEYKLGAGPIDFSAEALEAIAKDPIKSLEVLSNVDDIIRAYTAFRDSLGGLMVKDGDVIDVRKKTFIQYLKQAAVEIEQEDPVGRKGYADAIAKMLDGKKAELDTHKEMTDEQKEAYIDQLLSRLGKYDDLLKAARKLMEKQPTAKDSNSGDGTGNQSSEFAAQRAAVIQQYEEDQKKYGDKATALTPAGWGTTGALARYSEYNADRKKDGPLANLALCDWTIFGIAAHYARNISDERLRAGEPMVAKYLVDSCDAEKRRINGNTSE